MNTYLYWYTKQKIQQNIAKPTATLFVSCVHTYQVLKLMHYYLHKKSY